MDLVLLRNAACIVSGIITVLCAQVPKLEPTQVPFVGCESDGQIEAVEAPKGTSVPVAIRRDAAAQLAYYKSAQGLGVLAPRGWYCFGVYGSNGDTLFVSPQPIGKSDLFSSRWHGFSGPAIQLSYSYGDTSGRTSVARVIARVFPTRWAFVREVVETFEMPAISFPSGPYPTDRLTYKNKNLVEYETPANVDGLGTHSRLKKGDGPIRGIAILVGPTPDLLQVSVRLPTNLTGLATAIVSQVEADAERYHH